MKKMKKEDRGRNVKATNYKSLIDGSKVVKIEQNEYMI